MDRQLTPRIRLVRTISDKKISFSTHLKMSDIIEQYNDKQQACAEMLEVIKDCQTEEEVVEAVNRHYRTNIKIEN